MVTESPGARTETEYLALLDPDPIAATARYRALFTRLVKFFEWNGCRQSEDLAQETLRRGFARFSAGTDIYADDPNQYFLGIARFIVKESRKERRLQQADDAALESRRPQWSQASQDPDTAVLLEQCLALLDQTERQLVLRYHLGDRQRLRTELNVDDNTLRVRVHRAMRKMRDVVQPEEISK